MSLDNFKIGMQYLMPKHLISRLVGYLAQAKLGFACAGCLTERVLSSAPAESAPPGRGPPGPGREVRTRQARIRGRQATPAAR